MQTHTEISRQSPNLYSAEQVARTIGADLETVKEWLDVDETVEAANRAGKEALKQLLTEFPA